MKVYVSKLTFADWYFSIPTTMLQTLSVGIAHQVVTTVTGVVSGTTNDSVVDFHMTILRMR